MKRSAFDELFQGAKRQKSQTDSAKRVECPCCGIHIFEKFLNMHLDDCLTTKSNSSSNAEKKEQAKDKESNSSSKYGLTKLYRVNRLPLKGLYMVPDFITLEEESGLIEFLDSADESLCPPWKVSKFNGMCLSKGWGVKTMHGTYINKNIGHVRVNDPDSGELDLPPQFGWLLTRIHELWCSFEAEIQNWGAQLAAGEKANTIVQELKNIRINECNSNAYFKAQKHHLRPHVDDRFLSGPLLVNLSLAGRGTMRYQKEKEVVEARRSELGTVGRVSTMDHHTEAVNCIDVELPRRALQIVSGQARYDYEHSIPNDLLGEERRLSITFRMAGDRRKGVLGVDGTGTESIHKFLVSSPIRGGGGGEKGERS
jgi:alkylated DNA repair protein alkB family protein 4